MCMCILYSRVPLDVYQILVLVHNPPLVQVTRGSVTETGSNGDRRAMTKGTYKVE